MKTRILVAMGAVATLLGSGTAWADEWRVRLVPERKLAPEHLLTPVGTSLQLGGGVGDFTQSEVRALAGAAGAWNARAVFGTRSVIGAELGYVGSGQEVDALGIDDSAALVRNGFEANLRLSVPVVKGPWMIAPYAFGGLGWTRWELVNEGRNTSSVSGDDDVLSVPFGGGLATSFRNFQLDLRYAYYPTFDDELLRTPTGSTDEDAGLDSWIVALNLGYEF